MKHVPKNKSVVLAAMAGSLLMLITGLTYRVLATPASKIPIDPVVLSRFPTHIGDWVGQDIPLDEAVVRATETDAHINRQYSRSNGLESISFYVACGVNAQHVMSHRPEVCYVGAGWTLAGQQPMELLLNDGTRLPCTLFQFSRGALDTKRVTVLDYFIVDGQYCRDESLLRSKAWRNFRTVGYAIQVQILSPAESFSDASATKLVCDFAVDSISSMGQVILEIGKHGEGEPGMTPEGL